MLHVFHYKDPLDTKTFTALVRLYEGEHPIAPVLHQALTGNSLMSVYVCMNDQHRDEASFVGAGILLSPEIVVPLGTDVTPLAWVISDMVTHPDYRRQGIATLILKHMEGVVTRNGGRITYLYTDDANEAAKCVYEKAGFLRLKNQKDKAVYVRVVTDRPNASLE